MTNKEIRLRLDALIDDNTDKSIAEVHAHIDKMISDSTSYLEILKSMYERYTFLSSWFSRSVSIEIEKIVPGIKDLIWPE